MGKRATMASGHTHRKRPLGWNFWHRACVLSAMTDAAIPVRHEGKHALTWFGLVLSMVSMLLIGQVFRAINPEPGAALVLLKSYSFADTPSSAWNRSVSDAG